MQHWNLLRQKWIIRALLVVIGATIFSMPAYSSAIAQPPEPGWELKFNDEFNGTTLNANKWNTCYWWAPTGCTNKGNEELQWHQPDDVFVRNGKLHIRARKRSMNGYEYTSGMISSHDKYAFQYGYAEIRAKLPRGKGLWPAFWMIPQRHNAWPPEIDVMEYVGHDPTRVRMTLHYTTSRGNDKSDADWVGPDFSAGYHTFAVKWDPNSIIWYVDGVERKRYQVYNNIPHEPLYLVANLAVGGTWVAHPDRTTPFPSHYSIDYIRVWQRK